jgi:hypothetical protein
MIEAVLAAVVARTTLDRSFVTEVLPHALALQQLITLSAHVLESLASCARAACALGDVVSARTILLRIGSQREGPPADLMRAVDSVVALHSLAPDDAAALLMSLATRARDDDHGDPILLAALAGAQYRVGAHDAARTALDDVLTALVIAVPSSFADRFALATALLDAVQVWPRSERDSVIDEIDARRAMFGDTFTTARYFATHELLVAEHIVDARVV